MYLQAVVWGRPGAALRWSHDVRVILGELLSTISVRVPLVELLGEKTGEKTMRNENSIRVQKKKKNKHKI